MSAPGETIVLDEVIITPSPRRGGVGWLVGAGVIGGVVWALTRKGAR